jgi:RHS repeat-associated protein
MELEGSVGVPPANTVLRKYTWGLDLGGLGGTAVSAVGYAGYGAPALQGAGGIGGLLALEDVADPNDPNDNLSYVYLYDANGNVGQVVDLGHDPNDPAGAIVASYEYDPYGSLTAQAGSYAEENPFRWSTKYWDDETGLGYWGQRYYNPALGRWLNRDPIEELGGVNLYAYVGNDPVGRFDALGEMWCGREQGCYLDNGQDDGGLGGRCPAAQSAPTSKPQTRRKDCKDCWETCNSPEGQAALRNDSAGVICRSDGCLCACTNNQQLPGGPPMSARRIKQRCALAHEETHVQQQGWSVFCGPPDSNGLGRQRVRAGAQNGIECNAYRSELACLRQAILDGGCADNDCVKSVMQALVDTALAACLNYGCNVRASDFSDVLPSRVQNRVTFGCGQGSSVDRRLGGRYYTKCDDNTCVAAFDSHLRQH